MDAKQKLLDMIEERISQEGRAKELEVLCVRGSDVAG
jgi:hypothetical protein